MQYDPSQYRLLINVDPNDPILDSAFTVETRKKNSFPYEFKATTVK